MPSTNVKKTLQNCIHTITISISQQHDSIHCRESGQVCKDLDQDHAGTIPGSPRIIHRGRPLRARIWSTQVSSVNLSPSLPLSNHILSCHASYHPLPIVFERGLGAKYVVETSHTAPPLRPDTILIQSLGPRRERIHRHVVVILVSTLSRPSFELHVVGKKGVRHKGFV